ncbi:hypothetical protein AYK20_09525 [Thermoplasmatales archaeon SG8-52-1]|nr:MAG: hypothetical protein AYK20_09525 [Thermoplasmatales archaeon SG8-52-1]
MSPNKRNLIKNIEKQLNKTFEEFKGQNQIQPIDYLEKLNIKEIQNKNYRKIKYPYPILFKTIILMDITDKNQLTIVEYLKKNKRIAKRLGLIDIPVQSMLSRFINHAMDEETRIIRSYIKNNIIDLSKKAGISLGLYTLNIKRSVKQLQINNKGLKIKKGIKTKEIAEFFKNKTLKLIKFNGNTNEIYHDDELIDLLIKIGLERKCAHNVCNSLRLKNKKVPISDAFLRRMKTMKPEKIMNDFDLLDENLWYTIEKNRLYNRSVKIAVDFTDMNYYGKGTSMTFNKVKLDNKGKKKKMKCFRFITMDIVEPEGSYTLKTLPYNPLARKEESLYQLLKYAKQKLKIRIVLLDRGFFSIECIKVLKRLNLYFLMPAVRNEKIKEKEQQTPTPGTIKPYIMGDVEFDIIKIRDEKKEKDLLFATNMDFNIDNPNITKKLLSIYSKRWAIENGYKIKKNEFCPKTTSKNFNIRLYYFLFTSFIYNLWILVRILVNLSLYGRKKVKKELTAYIFGVFILNPG